MIKVALLAFIMSFVPALSLNASSSITEGSAQNYTEVIGDPAQNAPGDLTKSFTETEWETEWATENLESEETEVQSEKKTLSKEKETEKRVSETEKEKSFVEISRERFKLSDFLIQICSGIILFVIPYFIVVKKNRKR